jgi:hypothetical protein
MRVVISRTYYQTNKTISRPPQSRETIPLNLLAKCATKLEFDNYDFIYNLFLSEVSHRIFPMTFKTNGKQS